MRDICRGFKRQKLSRQRAWERLFWPREAQEVSCGAGKTEGMPGPVLQAGWRQDVRRRGGEEPRVRREQDLEGEALNV